MAPRAKMVILALAVGMFLLWLRSGSDAAKKKEEKPPTMLTTPRMKEEERDRGTTTMERTEGPKYGGEEQILRVISFNVLEGGRPGREEAIGHWIGSQQPDVVGLNEMNGWTRESLTEFAGRHWGHQFVLLAQTRSGFHVALTSRFPMEDPSIDVEHFQHACVSATIRGLRFSALHLRPDSGTARLQEVSFLQTLMDASGRQQQPWILLGDFNSLSPLDEMVYKGTHLDHIASGGPSDEKDKKLHQKFSFQHKLDFRVLQKLYDMGLKDLVHETQEETFNVAGMGHAVKFSPSVPTELDQNLDHMNLDHMMRLDYMLGTAFVEAEKCGAVRDRATAKLSDHYPLMCLIRHRQ